jgi:hypothetical protein
MITSSPLEFKEAFEAIQRSGHFSPKTMKAGLLVDPNGFNTSLQSAQDNVYVKTDASIDIEKAHKQHQGLARTMRGLGLPVISFKGELGHNEAVYCNNVFGTVTGRFIVGQMFHQVRQQEANRKDIRKFFVEAMGRKLCDLSLEPGVCELTGSMVIDRVYNVGFCGLSNRADEEGCRRMHEAFGLDATLQFRLNPAEYHTNIVLQILAGKVCVLYKPGFDDPHVADVIESLYLNRTASISEHEKNSFVANCIAATEQDVLMSRRASDALSPETRHVLERNGFEVHGVEVGELEKGGGSLRCLIAEIF